MKIVEIFIRPRKVESRERDWRDDARDDVERRLFRSEQILRALVVRAGGEVALTGDEIAAAGRYGMSKREEHATGDVRLRTGGTA